MTYFSRLTDIITCNLSKILEDCDDPKQTLQELLREMREGQAGALRSVNTADRNVDRISTEIQEHEQHVESWGRQARESLVNGNENDARHYLVRKKEAEDLVVGLKEQHQAAISTREHLLKVLRALEARLADAERRYEELLVNESTVVGEGEASEAKQPDVWRESRASEIEAELEALKRDMGL